MFLALCAFAGGAITSGSVNAIRDDGDETYKKLAIFARVLGYVENHYVEEVDSERLMMGAIRGMLTTLDAHSTYMDSSEFAAVKSEAQGEFGGIGVELVKREDRIVIVALHPDSPAERAGLVVLDRVVAIEDVAITQMGLTEVVQRIKGPVGSRVTLTVESVRGGPAKRWVLTRARIRIAAVEARGLGEGLGYVRLRSFSEGAAQSVRSALLEFQKAGAIRGLVLDLRDNPGGLVEQAVRVADLWLSTGVIVSTEGRNRPPEFEYAHPKATEPPYPMVVLVNGGTASASEIVAGALQDYGRATIVGTQTFGKGSVQTIIELEDRSALKLTIARYFTPRHRSIQGKGIRPDIVISDVRPPGSAALRPAGSPEALGTDSQLEGGIARLRARKP